MSDKTHSVVPAATSLPVQSIMHPMVAKMLENNPTPEALEKLLAMQRDWEAGEAKRAYTAALVQLKGSLPPFLSKDATVKYSGAKAEVRYTHTSLAGAMDTVTPHLTAHGFALTWTPGTNDKGGVTVTAKLTHRQGHSEQATLTAPPDTSGNKSSAQGIASTITLLQRYAALSLLGLASADMKEPEGDITPSEDAVDTARNMRALADLVKGGKTKDAVEAFVGKPVKEWIPADLDKLRAWIAPAVDDALVSKEEAANLGALMKEFQLDAGRFANIIEAETKRRPKGTADVRKSEYAKVMKAFDAVRVGAANLKQSSIEHPPA